MILLEIFFNHYFSITIVGLGWMSKICPFPTEGGLRIARLKQNFGSKSDAEIFSRIFQLTGAKMSFKTLKLGKFLSFK